MNSLSSQMTLLALISACSDDYLDETPILLVSQHRSILSTVQGVNIEMNSPMIELALTHVVAETII